MSVEHPAAQDRCACSGIGAEVLFSWEVPPATPMDGVYNGLTRCEHGQAFLVIEVGPSRMMASRIGETEVERLRQLYDKDWPATVERLEAIRLDIKKLASELQVDDVLMLVMSSEEKLAMAQDLIEASRVLAVLRAE